MRVAGVRCTKDKLDWAIVEGDDRASATVIDQVLVKIPPGDRGVELAYVRKEVLELLDRFAVDSVAVRVAESGGPALSPGRCEVEGVVQEALASRRIDQVRHVAASIRGAYKARNNSQLQATLADLPAAAAAPASRREAIVSAVALLRG
jgi:hypothetical protein